MIYSTWPLAMKHNNVCFGYFFDEYIMKIEMNISILQ